jgi:uncharacterized protein (TIGR02145 family)
MKKAIVLLALFCGIACGQKNEPQKDTFTDPRDGKKYKTTKIGEQTWMAENLNYQVEGSKCYENKEENCIKYGRLYAWDAAITACPSGWHLPTKPEWDNLLVAAGDNGAAKNLKTKSGWSSTDFSGRNLAETLAIKLMQLLYDRVSVGTDGFGFSALPGGYHEFGTILYHRAGNDGYWWTAEVDGSCAYFYNMSYRYDNAGEGCRNIPVSCIDGTEYVVAIQKAREAAQYMNYRYDGANEKYYSKHCGYGYSVRCLKN